MHPSPTAPLYVSSQPDAAHTATEYWPQRVADSLPQTVERLVSALQPERIYLFGSYARNKPTPDSDVDLLVVMETDLGEVDRFLAVSRLLRPRPFPVDILVKTPQEMESALGRGDYLLTEIVQQGRVLYERSA